MHLASHNVYSNKKVLSKIDIQFDTDPILQIYIELYIMMVKCNDPWFTYDLDNTSYTLNQIYDMLGEIDDEDNIVQSNIIQESYVEWMKWVNLS